MDVENCHTSAQDIDFPEQRIAYIFVRQRATRIVFSVFYIRHNYEFLYEIVLKAGLLYHLNPPYLLIYTSRMVMTRDYIYSRVRDSEALTEYPTQIRGVQ